MKNILKTLCVASLVVIILAGCGTKKEAGNTNNDTTTKASKGNCTVFECVKKLSPDNTLEEVNNLIGFEGTVKQESDEKSTSKWKIYTWELTDDSSVEITIYENSKTINIASTYPKDAVKNSGVDLSKANDMKSRINESDGLMYDEVKELLGGVDGILIKRSSFSDTYIWSNSNGGNVTANFSPKTNKCTSFTGLIK